MSNQSPPSCKIQVLWPELKDEDTFELEFKDASPLRRLQKSPANDSDVALLRGAEPGAGTSDPQTDTSTIILVANDGSLEVSSQALTAFSEHFARMSQSNMRETITRTVELSNFSLSTLKYMVAYMKTGELPSDLEELRQLSELSGYILHEPMECHCANSLLRSVSPDAVVFLAHFAVTQPTGILYAKILKYLSRSCLEDWFYANVLGPDGICLAVLRDLLVRDDLCVSSEAEVLAMIDTWVESHPGVDFANIADVVRSSWLPMAQRTRFFTKKSPPVPGDTNSEYCCRARQRYLRHVHIVTLETIRDRSGVCLQSHMENLDLPRVPPPPMFSQYINLLCSAEGRPTTILARFESPRPIDGGVICTRTPYKLEYFEHFGISRTPVIFMTIQSGVARLQLTPEISCAFIPLSNFTQRPITKLADICSCRSGLLIYLQQAEVDFIVLVLKDTEAALVVATIEVPITRPRFYLKDDLLHVECHYALISLTISLDEFSIVRRSENDLVVCDNDVLCEDLKELYERLCEDSSGRGSTKSHKSSSAHKPLSDGTQSTARAEGCTTMGGLQQQTKMELANSSVPLFSRFLLRCDDVREFYQKKTVSFLIPPRGMELFGVAGDAVNCIIGFVPRRLFTVSSICEPLPTH